MDPGSGGDVARTATCLNERDADKTEVTFAQRSNAIARRSKLRPERSGNCGMGDILQLNSVDRLGEDANRDS